MSTPEELESDIKNNVPGRARTKIDGWPVYLTVSGAPFYNGVFYGNIGPATLQFPDGGIKNSILENLLLRLSARDSDTVATSAIVDDSLLDYLIKNRRRFPKSYPTKANEADALQKLKTDRPELLF